MLCVGIDIGTYSIKVADVEPTSKSYVVRRIQEFPLSLDLTKDRKIEIIDTLRTLFAQYDLEQTHFIFGLPQKFVSARLMTLPFRERFKVQKAIVSQLEDELPFSQEDAIFDVKIVRYLGRAADVIAMAVPKERVSDLIDLAHDCGVNPTLISTEILGLNNLFERWDQPSPEGLAVTQEIPAPRQADVVVNIGHVSTDVAVYSEGLLLGVRHIDWGAKNLADAIGAKYGLNYLQGMRELQTKGFILLDKAQGTREQVAFSMVIEESLDGLINDMRLKMLELQSELNLQWTKGLLTGGGSQLKNLGAFFTQHFQVPFNKFKQFDAQAVSFDHNPHLEMVSPIAVGLAVEGLRRPRNPASNFMKDEFAQQSRVFEAMWEKWGYTAQLVASAFMILLVYSLIRDGMSASLLERSDEVMRKQAQDIAGIKASQASPEKISRFIKNQESLERARRQAEKVDKINSPLEVLERLSAFLPPRERLMMEIKRISIDNDNAEIHGYAGSAGERDQVMKAIQRVSSNGKADPAQLKIPVPPGKTGFAYKFHINRFAGG